MRLADLLSDRIWRHLESGFTPGDGDGGGDGAFPQGPGDRAPGYADPNPFPNTGNGPDSGYDPGPSNQQSYYHKTSKGAAPPDPWKDIPAALHDQAAQLVTAFENAMGWPTNFDANSAELALAQAGVNLTSSPFDAFDWLFNNRLSDAQRAANPWAQFGMTKDDYTIKVQKFNSVMVDWTGQQMTGDQLKQSIRGDYTPDEIRNLAIYGNAAGTGPMLEQAQLTGAMPWLSIGQTYTATLQGFQSMEDHLPSDTQTLAAWFRFGQSAKQLGSRPEAVTQLASRPIQAPSTTVR